MFIGYYKSVNSNKDFYSETRNNLDFPTQVVYKNERFLLNKTIQLYSDSQLKKVIDSAKKNLVEHDVKID